MNKIIVDEEYYSNNICDDKLHIAINSDTVIWINNLKDDINYEFELEDNTYLKVLDFNLQNKNVKFDIIQKNHTKFEYFHGFKIDNNYNVDIIAHLNGNNNVNNIYISGVAHGNVHIRVDGIVSENTHDNEVNENIKILTLDGKAFISPMLHVNTLDVIANHNTAISNIREDELFYLMSKGIDKLTSSKLIADGYLYGIFKNEEEFYKLIIND